MKKFFIAVISLVIVMITCYGIGYVISPVSSIKLEEYEHEISINCPQAYIVRDETIFMAPSAGTFYSNIPEGERVSNGTVISTVYPGHMNGEDVRKLTTLDKQINRLKEIQSQSILYSADSASVESAVSGKMYEIPDLSKENDIDRIRENKTDINSLRRGDEITVSEKITALEAEKVIVEAGMTSGKMEIISNRSGIFSSYYDGLEDKLLPRNCEIYDAEYIRSLKPELKKTQSSSSVVPGDIVCKVMNNHDWYVLGIVKSEDSMLLKEHKKATVRPQNVANTGYEGEIVFVTEPDINGECVFLVRVPSYAEIAFSYRNIDAEIIFEKYSGYKIPTEAIHTGENFGSYYVNAMLGSKTHKCECDVLYTDMSEGYSIIKSSDNAKNELSSMERLVVGER